MGYETYRPWAMAVKKKGSEPFLFIEPQYHLLVCGSFFVLSPLDKYPISDYNTIVRNRILLF